MSAGHLGDISWSLSVETAGLDPGLDAGLQKFRDFNAAATQLARVPLGASESPARRAASSTRAGESGTGGVDAIGGAVDRAMAGIERLRTALNSPLVVKVDTSAVDAALAKLESLQSASGASTPSAIPSAGAALPGSRFSGSIAPPDPRLSRRQFEQSEPTSRVAQARATRADREAQAQGFANDAERQAAKADVIASTQADAERQEAELAAERQRRQSQPPPPPINVAPRTAEAQQATQERLRRVALEADQRLIQAARSGDQERIEALSRQRSDIYQILGQEPPTLDLTSDDESARLRARSSRRRQQLEDYDREATIQQARRQQEGERAIAAFEPGSRSTEEQAGAAIDAVFAGAKQQEQQRSTEAKRIADNYRAIFEATTAQLRIEEQIAQDRRRAAAETAREAAQATRNQKRFEADQFQDRLRGLSRRERLEAIGQRIAELTPPGGFGGAGGVGAGEGGAGGGGPPIDPSDPTYREVQQLRRQREQLERSTGRRGRSRFPLYGIMFGLWEIAQSTASIERGETQAAVAPDQIQALDARLQALQQARGGILGSIAGLGIDTFGQLFGTDSFAKLENDSIRERARSERLDMMGQARADAARTRRQVPLASMVGFSAELGQVEFERTESRLATAGEIEKAAGKPDAAQVVPQLNERQAAFERLLDARRDNIYRNISDVIEDLSAAAQILGHRAEGKTYVTARNEMARVQAARFRELERSVQQLPQADRDRILNEQNAYDEAEAHAFEATTARENYRLARTTASQTRQSRLARLGLVDQSLKEAIASEYRERLLEIDKNPEAPGYTDARKAIVREREEANRRADVEIDRARIERNTLAQSLNYQVARQPLQARYAEIIGQTQQELAGLDPDQARTPVERDQIIAERKKRTDVMRSKLWLAYQSEQDDLTTIGFGITARAEQLNALRDRDPFRAQAIATRREAESQAFALASRGPEFEELGINILRNAAQEIGLQRRDYLEGFRATQTDLRLTDVSGVRDSEDPATVLAGFQKALDAIKDEIGRSTKEGVIEAMRDAIKH